MTRLSITLSEELSEWVETKSEELGVSKGQVIRECIKGVRGDPSYFTMPVNSGELEDRNWVNEIESRLDELEAEIYGSASDADYDTVASTVTEEPATGSAQATGDSPAVENQSTTAQTESTPNTSVTPAPDQSRDIPSSSEAGGKAAGADSTAAASTEEMQDVPDSKNADVIQSYLESTLDSEEASTAIFTCWKELSQRGTVHSRQLKENCEDLPPDYSEADVWWTQVIEPKLSELPGVVQPKGGGNFYRFNYR